MGAHSAEESLRWARSQSDANGMAVDPGIELPVAALHFLGVDTVQSCEGHHDRGLPYPWINLEDDSAPRLEEALKEYPLPGFAVQNNMRLLPQEALKVNVWSVLIGPRPPGVEVEIDSAAREQLLANLESNQLMLQQWAEKVLDMDRHGGGVND